MTRIGIFGGSFDPVHLGHLLVAQAAREEAQLDRVFFVPATQSPFKPDRRPASGPARAALLRIALAGKRWAEVDTQELDRGGISYSIDTVRNFHQRFPRAQFFYLIGADHFPQLPKWRDSSALAELATFLVIPRPGDQPLATPAPFNTQWLKGTPVAISASEIRARLRASLSIDHLVPPTAAEFILNTGLYS